MGGPGIRRCRGIRGDGKGGVVGWGGVGDTGANVTSQGLQCPFLSPWEPSATSWGSQCPHETPGVPPVPLGAQCHLLGPSMSPWEPRCHHQGAPRPLFPCWNPNVPSCPQYPLPSLGTPPPKPPRTLGGLPPPPPPKDAEPPTMSPRLYWCPQKGAICQLKHKDPRRPGCCHCHPGGGRRGGHSPGRGGSGGVAEDGGTHCLQLSHQGAQRHWGGDRGGQ